MRSRSTDVPAMLPSVRQGDVRYKVAGTNGIGVLFGVTVGNATVNAALASGRREPQIDDQVSVEFNPVTNSYRIL